MRSRRVSHVEELICACRGSRRSSCGFRRSGSATARQADHSSAEVESTRGQPKVKLIPKVFNSAEDAHTKSMSTLEAYEHLQAPTPSQYLHSLRKADRSGGGTLAPESIIIVWED
jgi:hypothetical protein